MPQSISIRAIAVGVPLLFAAHFALSHASNAMFPPPPATWLSLTLAAVWHCGVVLGGAPLAAGYVAGRVAGHDHELNGILTGLSFTLYVIVVIAIDENLRFDSLGNLPALIMGPAAGWCGGQLAAGRSALARPESAIRASEAAEQRWQKEAHARPGHKIVVLNDDRTPMKFIVEVLKRCLGMEHAAAIATMLHVHDHGRAIGVIYDSREAAQTKLAELTAFIASAGQPLRCVVETSESTPP